MSRKRMMIAIGNKTQMSTVDLITLRTVLSDAIANDFKAIIPPILQSRQVFLRFVL